LTAYAVDGEASAADAVGITADDRAEIGRMGRIVLETIETERQRRIVTLQAQILKDRAVGKDGGGKTATLDADAMDRRTVGGGPEDFLPLAHLRFRARGRRCRHIWCRGSHRCPDARLRGQGPIPSCRR